MDKPNGTDLERVAMQFFAKHGIAVSPLELGLSAKKKHCFDLGAFNPKILIECKSHTWTCGANIPSAKMTVWNEAMYYFHLAPRDYRKVLFVLHDRRKKVGESLLSYYRRTYAHLIPDGVEFSSGMSLPPISFKSRISNWRAEEGRSDQGIS